ncbi:hypothetical protein [Mucilaginibacter mallensis]|uniref:hypothetical protein n=1 Tax=Mucilaginibacter mallensis TaxID=652787 RepID=UPI000B8A0766|nr:hypothetical protein [Mucilaginibacter mallensis]
MADNQYFTRIKRHFIAFGILGLYFFCWIWLGCAAFYDFNNHGDGEEIGIALYSFLPCIFLPYFIITGMMAIISKQKSAFYWKLVWLILMPIPIAVVVGLGIYFLH